jgi:hypothetical protein
VRKTLEVFAPEFHASPVQLKTTTKPNDGLFYRYFYLGPIDHAPRAREAGLLESGNHPVLTLQEEILATCPGSSRGGLDFDTNFGLAKLWTFTHAATSVEELCRHVSAIPASVRAHLELFRHFGLERLSGVASDFRHHGMSLYFHWDLEFRTESWLRAFGQAVGGEVPSTSTCYDILATQRNFGALATTFTWDRPELLRWAPYSFEVPYDEPDEDMHRPALPPRLQVLHRAPTLNPQPQYNVSWSFGRAGAYMKLEKSYARDARYGMRRDTGADLSRDPARAIPLPRLDTNPQPPMAESEPLRQIS